MSERKIFILLTRFPSVSSRVIETFSGGYYTHASIGLEEDPHTYYSFNFRGFVVERTERFARLKGEGYHCEMYELPVSEKSYQAVRRVLHYYQEHPERYRYSRFGVVMCLIGIPYRRKNNYFCSQFVAEALRDACAVRLQKSSTLYRPCDFRRLPGVRFRLVGDLRDLRAHLNGPCVTA